MTRATSPRRIRLTASDLDLRTGTLTLRGKTGARTFPLPATLLDVLAEREGAEGPLLLIAKRSAAQVLRDRLKRACRRAGVPPFTPHGLRRMVVDRMIRGGVDAATAASLTGHSVEVMLRHYRQVSEDDRRKAVVTAGLGRFPGEVVPFPGTREETG